MTTLKLRVDLVYGATGSGKTYQLAKAAERMYRKYGKRSRLVAGDSGGTDTFGDLINEGEPAKGIVVPYYYVASKYPIEDLDKIVQGYWPNEAGELVRAPVPEDIGLYLYEGLTSFGDLMMRRLSAGKVRLSQDPNYVYVDGKTEFAGTNMSYYGEIQNRLYDFVVKSAMMSNRSIWTALEGRGEEEGSKTPTYGPSIVGKKAIGKAGQWFGNMLHLEVLTSEAVNAQTKQVDINQRRVMYLQPHADPLTKIPFPAKVRAPFNCADKVPFMMDPPDLGKLYDMLEQWRTGAPAVETVAAR